MRFYSATFFSEGDVEVEVHHIPKDPNWQVTMNLGNKITNLIDIHMKEEDLIRLNTQIQSALRKINQHYKEKYNAKISERPNSGT